MRRALSKAGFRPLTWGPFRVLLRPRQVKIAAVLALAVGLLVIYGVTRGSLPIPTSAIGRALFYPDVLSAQQMYIVRDSPTAPADGCLLRRHAGAGRGGDAVDHPQRSG